MTRLFLLPLFLAVALVGCDAAAPSASADWRGEGGFGSCEFSIAGPNTLATGQTAQYYITSETNCLLQDSDWNVGFNGTLVSSDETTALIQAGPNAGTIWVEVNVTYYENGVLAITEIQRTISVQ